MTGFIVPLNSARWLHSIFFVTESFLCESINYPRIKPLNSQFSALPHRVRDSEKEEFVEDTKKSLSEIILISSNTSCAARNSTPRGGNKLLGATGLIH